MPSSNREKNKPLQSNRPPLSFFPYWNEVIGVCVLFLTLFVALSVFSFSASDPEWDSAGFSSSRIENLAGLLGAYTADFLFLLLGLASYPFLLLLAWLGISFFREKLGLRILRLLGFIFCVGLLCVFFQLRWPSLDLFGKPILGGGWMGHWFASPLQRYLNSVGAYLVVSFFALLTFLFGTGLSVKRLFLFVKRFFWACGVKLRQLTSSLVLKFQNLWEQALVRQEQRRKAYELSSKSVSPSPTLPSSKKSGDIRMSSSPNLGSSSNVRSDVNSNSLSLSSSLSSNPDSYFSSNLSPSLNPSSSLNPSLDSGPVDLKPIDTERSVGSFRAQESTESSQKGIEEQGPKIFQRLDLTTETSAEVPQPSFTDLLKSFVLPSLDLLDIPETQKVELDETTLRQNAQILERKLLDYGVEGRVTEIHPGPVITMYEFEPASGVKVSKIVNLEDDLTLAMGGRSVRIVPHLQGKPAVGIEIPNHQRETVGLKEILVDARFLKAESRLTLALGKDIEGIPFVSDLQKMPHLLVAGATGAGKSVCLNAIILSILFKASPDEVRLLFVDPKMLELSIYQGIPHLLLPVVTDPKKAAIALRWAVAEMERRYKLMSHAQVRNLAGYNKKIEKGLLQDQVVPSDGNESATLKHEEKLPFIVIIIDELADLMLVAGREIEEYITRLAQMARAAGIHLILATQRPSVDVITGIIKANFPARISFKVSSSHDSRTIIDAVGAENLLGAGDMLFLPPGIARLLRVHGAFVSDTEVMRVVEHLKSQAKPIYDESILQFKDSKSDAESENIDDELYDQAVSIVTESRQASISMVQRRLRIGYNRAARLIEQMESEGIVSAADGARGREVLAPAYRD